MSRSAERAVVAGVVLALALPVSPAGADQGHSHALIAHTYRLHATTSDPAGTARVSSAGASITASLNANLAFGKDSAELTPAAIARISQIASQLRAAGAGQLQVIGYTDDLGTHAHGVALSQARAQAVATRLGNLAGITISVAGKAEADPLVPNTSEENRAQNRRVEIHYRHR